VPHSKDGIKSMSQRVHLMSEQWDELHRYILTEEIQCGSFAKEHFPGDGWVGHNV
jgi:hypothetical protein